MDAYTLTNNLQKIENDMMIELMNICEKNEINFYLACGTTLGCVRHSGFIPWDDDVDIYMYPKDYIKLKDVIKKEFTTLRIDDGYDTLNYPYSFPKIVKKDSELCEQNIIYKNYKCGIYIDIFILMEAPKNGIFLKFNEMKRYFYYCIIKSHYNVNKGFKKKLSIILKKIFNIKKTQKKLYNMYFKTYKNSKYVIDIGIFGKKALLKKSFFEEGIKLPFNDLLLLCPLNYHEYLNHYYGDYMQLPDIKDRVSNHNFIYIKYKDILYEKK